MVAAIAIARSGRLGHLNGGRIRCVSERRIRIDKQRHVRNGARSPAQVVELEVADAFDRVAGDQDHEPVDDGEDVRGGAEQARRIEPVEPRARTDEDHVGNCQDGAQQRRQPVPSLERRFDVNRHRVMGDRVITIERRCRHCAKPRTANWTERAALLSTQRAISLLRPHSRI